MDKREGLSIAPRVDVNAIAIFVIMLLLLAALVMLARPGAAVLQDTNGASIYSDKAGCVNLTVARSSATVFVNATGSAGSSGDWATVDIHSTSDATGFTLTCSRVGTGFYEANFSMGASTNAASRVIQVANGDTVSILKSSGTHELYASFLVDDVPPTISDVGITTHYLGATPTFPFHFAGAGVYIYSDDDGKTTILNISGNWSDAGSGLDHVVFEAGVFGDSPVNFTNGSSSVFWTDPSTTYTIDPAAGRDVQLNITAYDRAGNSAVHTLSFYQDNDAPLTLLDFDANEVTFKGTHCITPSTQLTLSPTDNRGNAHFAGLNITNYRINSNGTWTAYSAPFTVGAGEHRLYYNSSDMVDNREVINYLDLVVGHNMTTWTVGPGEDLYFNDTCIYVSSLDIKGNLTLRNSSMIFYGGTSSLLIEDGGRLTIRDSDNSTATPGDASGILGQNSHLINTLVEAGGTLDARYSNMSGVNIEIHSSSVTVESCHLQHYSDGIVIDRAFPRIANCTMDSPITTADPHISVNDVSGFTGKRVRIVGNNLSGVKDIGIDIQGNSYEGFSGTGHWVSGTGKHLSSDLSFSVNLSTASHPFLIFHDKAPSTLAHAHGWVNLSTDGGKSYPNTLVSLTHTSTWRQNVVDLAAYRGSDVNITFNFTSDATGDDDGWYVDELLVDDHATASTVVRNLEYLNIDDSEFNYFKGEWIHGHASVNDAGMSGDSWEFGTPGPDSGGPSSAHSGLYCWGTGLNAGTGTEMSYLEINSSFVSAGGNLTFYHWYNCGGARVEISTDGGVGWNILDNLSSVYNSGSIDLVGGAGFSGNSNGWVLTGIDMDPYLGQECLVRFAYYSSGAHGGWFVDDISYPTLSGRALLFSDTAEYLTSQTRLDGFRCTANGVVLLQKNDIRNASTGIQVYDSLKTVLDANKVYMEGASNPLFGTDIRRSSVIATSNRVSDTTMTTQGGMVVLGSESADSCVQLKSNIIQDINGTQGTGIFLYKSGALVNSNTITDSNNGIGLMACSHPSILNNNILEMYGNGIMLLSDERSFDVKLVGNDMDGCGLDGLNISWNSSALIDSNTVKDAGERGGGHNGITSFSRWYCTMSSNKVTGSGGSGIWLGSYGYYHILADNANDSKVAGLYISDGTVALVEGASDSARSTYAHNGVGVFSQDLGTALDGPVIRISYVNALENDRQGFRLYNFTSQLFRSEGSDNGEEGLYMLSPVEASVNTCTFYRNGADGILVEGGRNVDLSMLVSSDNGDCGIELYRSSVASLERSLMDSNDRYGAYLHDDWTPRGDISIPRGAFNSTTVMNFTRNTVTYNGVKGLFVDYDLPTPSCNVWTVMVNGNTLSYNTGYDLDTSAGVYIDWHVDSATTTANTIRRFDGMIRVDAYTGFTLNSANIKFMENGNGLTTQQGSSVTFSGVTTSVASGVEDITFNCQGSLSIGHSLISDASSIYVKPPTGMTSVSVSDSVISGGTHGLYLISTNAHISSTTIRNMEFYGIYAKNSDVRIEGSIIRDCDQALYILNASAAVGHSYTMDMFDTTIVGNNQGVKLVKMFSNIYNSSISEDVTDLSLDGGHCNVFNSTLDSSRCQVTGTLSPDAIERYWFLTIIVKDEYGAKMDGTTFLLKDGKDVSVYSGPSDANGMLRDIACMEYSQGLSGVDRSPMSHKITVTVQGIDMDPQSRTVSMDHSQSVHFIYDLAPVLKEGSLPVSISTPEDTEVTAALYPYSAFVDTTAVNVTVSYSGGFHLESRSDHGLNLIPEANWNGNGSIVVRAADAQGHATTVTIPVVINAVNDAPVISNVTISPIAPTAGMTMSVTYDVYDVDGDKDVFVILVWHQNRADGSNAEYTFTNITGQKKGEVWWCTATASDGMTLSIPQDSEKVTISNSVPTISGAVITPSSNVLTDTNLEASATGWYDIDKDVSDTNGLLYRWQRSQNGLWLDIPQATGKTLTSDHFIKGDHIRVIVTPYEDLDIGVPVTSASITVGNSRPVIGSLGISPSSPDWSTSMVVVGVSGSDPDLDQLYYRFEWTSGNASWGGVVWGNSTGENAVINGSILRFWVGKDVTLTASVRDSDWLRGDDVSLTFHITRQAEITDTDGDGLPDNVDTDDDGDGWTDTIELELGTDPLDITEYPLDTDSDGIPDIQDDDDDNDHWTDMEEARYHTDPLDAGDTPDENGNGIPDVLENQAAANPSGHGTWLQGAIVIILLIILAVIILAAVLFTLRSRIAPLLGLDMDREEGGADYSALLEAMKGMGSGTKLLPASTVNVEGVDLSRLDLETELVECGACGELVPENSKECPACGAIFDEDIVDTASEEYITDLERDAMDELEDADELEDLDDFGDDWDDEPPLEKSTRGKKHSGTGKGTGGKKHSGTGKGTGGKKHSGTGKGTGKHTRVTKRLKKH